MLAVTRHGLRGKAPHAAVSTWGPSSFTSVLPIVATPPGANPGSISTTPTVTTVQTSPPTALPPSQPPPEAPVTPWPPSADVPTVTAQPGFQPGIPGMPTRKAWVPWAIGGGIAAALGAAAVVFFNR